VALALATLARLFAASMGFDSFTTFIVFLIVLAVLVVVYLSIHMVLQNLMLPWIGKGLAMIPYFRKKIEQRQVPIVEQQPDENNTNGQEQASLEDIRNEQQQNISKDQEDKLNIALNYTRESFALYLSDEEIEALCLNVGIYVDRLNEKKLKPVKVKELSTIDLLHFGWNIWNFFKPRNQMDIASFLKAVFPDIFRDTEVETIKRHLKDDELKGIIKIRESISE
jgi:hypothetical protein